jgi:hypothetical protein
MHEAEVSFLDEVQEIHAGTVIFFGDGDDETEVGFNDALGGFLITLLGEPPKLGHFFLGHVLQTLDAVKIQRDGVETLAHAWCIPLEVERVMWLAES